MPSDYREIVVTIKLDQSAKETTDASVGNVKEESVEKNTTSKEGAAYKALAIQAGQVAINEALAWANYSIDKQYTLNDDYVGQRNKNIALAQINKGISAISTIGSFALLGSAAGPVGAVIGGAVGTLVAGAGIIRENIQGEQNQQIALNQMEAQLEFTRKRAGWSTQAASIGEDL